MPRTHTVTDPSACSLVLVELELDPRRRITDERNIAAWEGYVHSVAIEPEEEPCYQDDEAAFEAEEEEEEEQVAQPPKKSKKSQPPPVPPVQAAGHAVPAPPKLWQKASRLKTPAKSPKSPTPPPVVVRKARPPFCVLCTASGLHPSKS